MRTLRLIGRTAMGFWAWSVPKLDTLRGLARIPSRLIRSAVSILSIAYNRTALAIKTSLARSHRRFRYGSLALFAAVIIIWGSVWLFNHWQDADKEIKLTNFGAAFFPFVVSVFVAFIPDIEKSAAMRRGWRIGIIAAGLVYSLILWHQQSVNIIAGRRDQTEIVRSAVEKSNKHSDNHSDEQTAQLRKELQASATHSDEQVETIRKEAKDNASDLAGLVSKTTSDLGQSISKVGKPDPPIPATLVFTLWSEETFPLLLSSLAPNEDGIYTIDFAVSNTSSSTAARQVDTWIDICEACTFAKEPSGFDRPDGMRNGTRHMTIQILNPSTSIGTKTIAVKLSKPLDSFDMGFRYTCELCGGGSHSQIAKIIAPVHHDFMRLMPSLFDMGKK